MEVGVTWHTDLPSYMGTTWTRFLGDDFRRTLSRPTHVRDVLRGRTSGRSLPNPRECGTSTVRLWNDMLVWPVL